jgi:hypothetical protein
MIQIINFTRPHAYTNPSRMKTQSTESKAAQKQIILSGERCI